MSENKEPEIPGPKVMQNRIIYSINEEEKTASVIGIEPFTKQIYIYIPRSIKHESKEYIITSIYSHAFESLDATTVEFSADSEIRTIGKEAFIRSKIERFTIPPHVTKICELAFRQCEFLTELEVPPNSQLEIIEKEAFSWTKFQRFTIPPHLTTICESAFSNCQNLRTIEISSNSELRTIEKNAFASDPIEKFTIPASLVDLRDKWCRSFRLNEVEISPENPRYKKLDDKLIVGKSTVNSEVYDELVFCCRDAKKVTVPHSIKTIKACAFESCIHIEAFEIPENSELQTIGKYALSFAKLERFTIPPHLTTICKGAFKGLNVKEIEIPPNSIIHTIGKCAFSYSTIERFTIPPHLTKIDECTFSECKKLKVVDYFADSELKTIENDAFSRSSIESLSIPASLIELKEKWCSNTVELNEVNISSKNPRYSLYGGQLIVGKSSLDCESYDEVVFCCRNCKKVTIPNSIKTILPYSFVDCSKISTIDFSSNSILQTIGQFSFVRSSIKTITIPSTVTTICQNAFYDCSQLRTVVIPDNSELRVIEEKAFFYSEIRSFKIPRHLTQISDSAFLFCRSLNKVKIQPHSELKIIGNSAFESTGIQEFVIPPHVTKIGTSAFGSCYFLHKFDIPSNSSLETICSAAFSCTQIETLSIPSTIVELEDEWFERMNQLKTIDLSPENPRYTKYCDKMIVGKMTPDSENYDEIVWCKLQKVVIQSHIKKFAPYAFENIESIEIPDDSQLQIIGNGCFSQSKIEKFILPNSVTEIGDNAFDSCYELRRFVIDNKSHLESIGSYAFRFSYFDYLFIPSHVKKIDNNAFCNTSIKIIECGENIEIGYFKQINLISQEIVILIVNKERKL